MAFSCNRGYPLSLEDKEVTLKERLWKLTKEELTHIADVAGLDDVRWFERKHFLVDELVHAAYRKNKLEQIEEELMKYDER